MREPDPETLAKIVGDTHTNTSAEGQFASAEPPPGEEHRTPPAPQTENNVSSQSAASGTPPRQTHVEGHGKSSEKEGQSSTGTASPSSSEVVQQLKATLKQGTKVASPPLNPLSQEFVPVSPQTLTKLNPGAQPFTPFALTGSTPGRNPSAPPLSSAVTNGRGTLSETRSPFSPKFPIFGGIGAGSGTAPNLDPNSQEFVPRSFTSGKSLNATAPEFVPTIGLPSGMQNGDPSLAEQFEDVDFQLEEELQTLKASDIVQGFERISEVTDDGSQIVLNAGAEMLLKSTLYPASYERQRLKLETTLKAWPPSEDTLHNLTEMIIHWGTVEPGLRLMASRICHSLSEMELNVKEFSKLLMIRLQGRFKKQKKTGISTDEEREHLINFSLFFAELFARIRVREAPIDILGLALFQLLEALLNLKDNSTIIGACNVLKLTGALLESCEKTPQKMEQILDTLRKLSMDETLTLSSRCMDLMLRVIELHAKKWGKAVSPAPATLDTSLHQFIFQEPQPQGGEFYGLPTIQAPVSNPEEWNEFLDDDDQVIEDTDIPDYAPHEGVDPEALDPEIQQEFEAFIEEIEEHLMMQEFGPEPESEEQQDTASN